MFYMMHLLLNIETYVERKHSLRETIDGGGQNALHMERAERE